MPDDKAATDEKTTTVSQDLAMTERNKAMFERK